MCHFAGILCESVLYYGTDETPAICDIIVNVPICRGFIKCMQFAGILALVKYAQFATIDHFSHFGVVYAYFDPI